MAAPGGNDVGRGQCRAHTTSAVASKEHARHPRRAARRHRNPVAAVHGVGRAQLDGHHRRGGGNCALAAESRGVNLLSEQSLGEAPPASRSRRLIMWDLHRGSRPRGGPGRRDAGRSVPTTPRTPEHRERCARARRVAVRTRRCRRCRGAFRRCHRRHHSWRESRPRRPTHLRSRTSRTSSPR